MAPSNQAAAVALLLALQAASSAPVGLPAAVLTGDDPCLDGRGHGESCGTGLLQHGGAAKLLQRRIEAERIAAGAASAASAETADKAEALALEGPPARHEHGGRKALPVEAVSFVQERMQSAKGIMPRNVHEALFGPLAVPLALVPVALTGLVFLARCVGSGGDEGRRTKDPAAVGGAAEGRGLHIAVDESGQPLCPELLVPGRSKCVVAVPRLAAARRDGAFVVADKVGQSLFKGSFSRAAAPASGSAGSAAAPAAAREQVSLARQDGSGLALCELILPAGAGGRGGAECRILQRNGQLFASLRRDAGQASWLARALRRSPPEPPGCRGSFVFETCSASGGAGAGGGAAWEVRAEGGPGPEQRLRVLDAAGRTMAVATGGASLPFDTGGRDFYRVEVGGELDTDLGLVTVTLLAVDRLLAANRRVPGTGTGR